MNQCEPQGGAAFAKTPLLRALTASKHSLTHHNTNERDSIAEDNRGPVI